MDARARAQLKLTTSVTEWGQALRRGRRHMNHDHAAIAAPVPHSAQRRRKIRTLQRDGAAGTLRRLTINNLNLQSLGNEGLDALRFENDLREFYIDMKFRGVPLSIRAGRQQVVWGETDNFRMLDRINSLNLTWHFQQEIPAPAFGWDEIRRPFWMFKFLYDLGNVWKFSQSFLEWYWNPGDWLPAKQAFLPRPWGLPFYNSLTNVVDGAFFDGPCGANRRSRRPPARARGKHVCNAAADTTRSSSGRATTTATRSTTARSACGTTASRPSASSSRSTTSTSASPVTTAPTTPR